MESVAGGEVMSELPCWVVVGLQVDRNAAEGGTAVKAGQD